MTNISPLHVINHEHGTTWKHKPNDAREIMALPRFTFSHLEWPSHAWPGGYPIYYVVADGGVLCPSCANQELYRTIDPDDDQFHIVASDINYEDQSLYCDHCNSRIDPAYGED
jgi:hypothetical protein